MLLPVLLAHAPRIRMREVSAALLRTRFAPSLLHVSAMNDPLSLERYCEATSAGRSTYGIPRPAGSTDVVRPLGTRRSLIDCVPRERYLVPPPRMYIDSASF